MPIIFYPHHRHLIKLSPTQTMPENLTEKKSTSERELLVLILNELRAIRKEIRQSNSVQPSVGNR